MGFHMLSPSEFARSAVSERLTDMEVHFMNL